MSSHWKLQLSAIGTKMARTMMLASSEIYSMFELRMRSCECIIYVKWCLCGLESDVRRLSQGFRREASGDELYLKHELN